MKKIFLVIFLFCSAISLGCQNIQSSSRVSTTGTKVGNELVALKGDAVIEIINRESLPNLFGKADVFGRTRPTGTTSLIFLGGSSNKANFLRRDVIIRSEKTTMNSTPLLIPNNSKTTTTGMVGNTSFTASSNTYNSPIFLPANTPKDQISSIREIKLSVSSRKGKNSIKIAGKTMRVLSVTNNQLSYKLE